MAHTPGPWRFGVMEYTDDFQEVFTEKPFSFMAGGYNGNPSIYAGNEQIVGCDEYYVFSNANDIRLIAAAPDLLEALQALLDRYVQAIGNEGIECYKARAAIAKATLT